MAGFTYNGIHSNTYSCYYIPDEEDKMNVTPSFEVTDDDVTGRHGGYYYRNRVKSRDFTLTCYFEDISTETLHRIFRWLDRNTSGELIFDDRPFVIYHVRPTKRVEGKIYPSLYCVTDTEVYSGTFDITFTAYEPFGELAYKAYDTEDTDGVTQYCPMIAEAAMPAAPTTSDTSFMVYNCGTQTCDSIIRIGGTAADGLIITNTFNGTKCTLTSLPENGYLEINSKLGTVVNVTDDGTEYMYELHDDGYITLAPVKVYAEDATLRVTAGSSFAYLSNCTETQELVGKYLLVNNGWHKITSVTKLAKSVLAVLEDTIEEAASGATKAVEMNEITIEGTGISLTTLEIDYTPLVY